MNIQGGMVFAGVSKRTVYNDDLQYRIPQASGESRYPMLYGNEQHSVSTDESKPGAFIQMIA